MPIEKVFHFDHTGVMVCEGNPGSMLTASSIRGLDKDASPDGARSLRR